MNKKQAQAFVTQSTKEVKETNNQLFMAQLNKLTEMEEKEETEKTEKSIREWYSTILEELDGICQFADEGYIPDIDDVLCSFDAITIFHEKDLIEKAWALAEKEIKTCENCNYTFIDSGYGNYCTDCVEAGEREW